MASATFLNKAYLAYFGRPVDFNGSINFAKSTEAEVQAAFSASAESIALYGTKVDAGFINSVYQNLFGRSAELPGITYWLNQIAIGAVTPAGAALAILGAAQGSDLAAVNNKLAACNAFTLALDTTAEAVGYSGTAPAASARSFIATVAAQPATSEAITAAVAAAVVASASAGTALKLDESTTAGLKTMRLTGDQDVRIDMTTSAKQITGRDLNGNGVIENDGKENAAASYVDPVTGKMDKDFKAVDAYTRLSNGVVNETDLATVFKGDIYYDGTGFAGNGSGNGPTSNGNIVLGGLGADTLLGGIGNDFFAAGGVAKSRVGGGTDSVSAGRNADFIFAELSLLSNTDGNKLFIDGGATADDTSAANGQSAQDSDWLLLQASDDDERIEVVLTENAGTVGTTPANDGTLVTRAGQFGTLRDIENIDASGNTYGFIKNLNTTLGGAPVNANNNGIGSSGQLNITGSTANNIIIGGYDNDAINAGAGNDLLMGGNLKSYTQDGVTVAHQILDPNLVGLVGNNNGRDELTGGAGVDQIVFEADGGIIEGGSTVNADDNDVDTLWLTETALGAAYAAGVVTPVAASALVSDSTLRFDLGVGRVGGLNNFSGYGGADSNAATGNFTADQSKYISNASRVQVQDMENVIATGLGGVDFLAAGANTAADVAFQNQQNFQAYNGNLDLRGTEAAAPQTGTTFSVNLTIGGAVGTYTATYAGVLTVAQAQQKFVAENAALWASATAIAAQAVTPTNTAYGGENTLYATTGKDVIEGRTGNDLLSGGDAADNFIFNLNLGGDGLDVIWRQVDEKINATQAAGSDNLWDAPGLFEGMLTRINKYTTEAGKMGVDFGKEGNPVTGPSKLEVDFTLTDLAAANKQMSEFSIKIGGVTFAITEAADIVELKAATSATDMKTLINRVFSAKDPNVTADATGNVLTITDKTATGGRAFTDVVVKAEVTEPGQSVTNPVYNYIAPGTTASPDRLVFAAYQDRADGELVDDDAVFGGDTLGANAYAQDLVVGFDVGGSTIVAENQEFWVTLNNLAVQDKVTVNVNNVLFTLEVGKAADGTLIAGETTIAFAGRMATYIQDYLDDDTAAGKLNTVNFGNGTFSIKQNVYAGEETVFMQVSADARDNSSNGEPATALVTNASKTDITLYQYSGRDGKLNATNVLFVGDSGVGPDGRTYSENSRAVLETAKAAGGNLYGSDAIVVNVTPDVNITNSALESIRGTKIYFNVDENPTTGRPLNYAIHGDDQLFGAAGADNVLAGTGNDRVYGSLGADTIDGGKDLWLVDGVIRVLNDREAALVDADPLVLSISRIDVNLDGVSNANDKYSDTLIWQQSDFGSVGAGGATFNIALDLSAEQANGGAGRVITNGLAANTTYYTNMENIRTVSGNGTLAGQGNDTLDLSISVNPITKTTTANTANMRYFLTKDANSGNVHMVSTVLGNAQGAATAANLFTKVDGVENVIGGTGTDYLYIDQTESGKNNSFNAGGSTAGTDAAQTAANGDKIIYQNNAVALTALQLPKIVLAVGANDVDTVTMTGGQLLAGDAPIDTLTGVEFIDVDAVARNVNKADELNVAQLAGAGVSYITGQVTNGAALVSTVIGVNQLEVVTGSTGNDTVFMAPAVTMGGNASADVADAAENEVGNILFDTYLTYDVTDEQISAALDVNITPQRMNVAQLRAVGPVGSAAEIAAQAAIVDAINQSLFKQNLGGGTADTVDYSQTNNTIAAVVSFDANAPKHYVLVDSNANGSLRDVNDRIDEATGVERFVASQGASTLDLTNTNQDLKITFSNNFDDTLTTSWDANFAAGKYGREVHEIKVANALSSQAVVNTSYIDYVYVDTSVADLTAIPAAARWTNIQGSDYNETVELSGYEAGAANTLVLRGGDNVVTYEGSKIAATFSVVDYVAATPTTTGLITANIVHTAVNDDHNPLTVADPTTNATDVVSSYSQQNGVKAGTLTIKATRGSEDSFAFDPLITAGKLYVFGGAVDATPSINVQVGAGATANSLQLIGFELVQDSNASNDVYDLVNFATISPDLRLVDGAPFGDHDTIKIANNAAGLDGDANAATIDLAGLRLAANNTYLSGNFNTFDVLDVTNVTGAVITTVAGTVADVTDELVVGALPGIVNATLFESLVLTKAFTDLYGANITLNTTTNTVTAGAKTLTADVNLRTLSLGGTALDNSFNLESSLAVAGAVNLTATGAGAVTLIGGSEANTLQGAGGNDTLRGGKGNDILDGGFMPEVVEVQRVGFTGTLLPANNAVVTLAGVSLTEAAAAVVPTTAIDGRIVAGSNAAQIAAAFAAAPKALFEAGLGLAAGDIASVTADGLGNLSFTFRSGFNAADGSVLASYGIVLNGDAGTLNAGAGTNVAYAARVETADTYVFEATGALNGADILNNVDASDTFNFDAFLGAGNGGATAVAAGNFATLTAVGGTIAAGTDLVTAFNKATLSSVDFAAAATAGKFFVADNQKTVFAVSADADGLVGGADVTQNSWNLYYVANGAVAGVSDLTVTLVGTVNTSAGELNEAAIAAML